MSGMIERVARAMAESHGVIWGGPRGEDDPDFQIMKMAYLRAARAAIEAQLEPTDEMIDAAVTAWLESASDYTRLRVSIRASLKAANAAALSEDGE